MDGSCGCAFGGALLAAGVNSYDWSASLRAGGYYAHQTDIVKTLWPWLTDSHLFQITMMYSSVLLGTRKIEEIADYVRSIEPSEDSVIPDNPAQLSGIKYPEEATAAEKETLSECR